MAENFCAQTRYLVRAVYAKFHHQDKGATGGLGPDEFGNLLISIGVSLPEHERQAFFDYLSAPH